MNLYLRILKFIRPYLGRLIAAGFCTVMTAAANLYVPWIVRDVIDKVFQNKDRCRPHGLPDGLPSWPAPAARPTPKAE